MNKKQNSEIIARKAINTDNFNALYEGIIDRLTPEVWDRDTREEYKIIPKLRTKREVGLAKYGKDSFQSSLENALNCPTLEHALDELLDCINYILHEIAFKSSFLYPEQNEGLKEILENAISLYREIQTVKLAVG